MTRRELIMNLRAGALVWEFRRQLVDIEQAKPPSQGFIWFPGMAMPGRIPQKCSEHLTGKKKIRRREQQNQIGTKPGSDRDVLRFYEEKKQHNTSKPTHV